MKPPPFSIRPLRINPPVALAPMAGYTNYAFRSVCHEHHCPLSFTEMVISEGIVRHTPLTMNFLESHADERPVGAHIYGHDPDSLVEAARIVEQLGVFDLIDLNCGCPVPKIKRRGAGVGMMKDPQKLYGIIKRMTDAVSLPVTVKTRTGLTPAFANLSEVAAASEEGGAAALFVHARLASDVHRGPADLEALSQIKQERTIPVIGNGGITQAEQATKMIKETGVDGVMIGRAAIGNPWIFEELHCLWNGQSYTPPTRAERREVMVTHLERLHASMQEEEKTRKRRTLTAEQAACLRFRSPMIRYLGGIQGLGAVRKRLSTLDSLSKVMSAIDEVLAGPTSAE